VKLVEELGLRELTAEQIETLCLTAENAARKHILAKVSSKTVEKLNVSIEADGAKPVNLTVEIDIALSPQTKDLNLDKLVDEAVKEALKVSENYLRKLT
jgi:GGDEF domain-containing protein